jgi:beta-lactamase regulating signal transducer with metallopeptidase domain/5-hydroxyisourate hydrolase-like protein (transthyretin family)
MFAPSLALSETALLKLADFHLASTAVLAAALLVTGLLRQPAQRLAIAWASMAGMVLSFVLAMVPGWSMVYLEAPTPVAEADFDSLIGVSSMPADDRPFGTPPPPPSFDGVVAPAAFTPPVAAAAEPRDWLGMLYTAAAAMTLGGAAVTLAWLTWGAIVARRIVAQAEAAGVEAQRTLAELAAPSPTPRLLISDRLATAVAIGLRRPAILLPRQMAAGGASDLRALLAHELAHVRGGDLWLLAGLRLVMVVLWPNPLYWALRRRVRLDQETLADAAAAELAGRHDYAERLVSWARDLSAPPHLAGAAGIWEGQSQLRSRIAVLLDERFTVLRRSSLQWRASCGVGCLVLASVASLVTLGPAEERFPPAGTSNDRSSFSGSARDVDSVGKIIINGRVVDSLGRPIADAEVGLVLDETDEHQQKPNFLSTAKTNAKGDFLLTCEEKFGDNLGTVWAYAVGYQPTRPLSVGLIRGISPSGDSHLELMPAALTKLRLLHGDRTPVADAKVHVSTVRLPQSIGFPLPLAWRDRFGATTDAEGYALIESVPADAIDGLRVNSVRSGEVIYDGNYFLNVEPAKRAPHFEICLPRPGSVAGELVSTDQGAPITTAVNLHTEVRPEFGPRVGIWGIATATPDQRGKFSVQHLAAGRLTSRLELPNAQPWRARTPARVSVKEGELTLLSIALRKGVKISGVVRKVDTKDGYPGFRLGVMEGGDRFGDGNTEQVTNLVTDEDGRYEAIVLPGPIELRLMSAPRDYQSDEWWKSRSGGIMGPRREVPADVAEYELPPIDLVRTKEIEGRLIDQNGRYLSGWNVSGYPQEGVMNSFAGVLTDRDGKFRNAVPETQLPTIWKVSFRDWSDVYDFEDRTYVADIVSATPFVLRVDVDGRPTEGREELAPNDKTAATVQADSEAEPWGVLAPATSDYPMSQPGEPNVVAGLCLNAEGEPLAGVEVLLLHRRSDFVPIKQVGRVTTGADGRFRFEKVVANPDPIELRRTAPIEELYHVVTRREGYASRSLAQPPSETAIRGVNVAFRLRPAATLTGRVTDSAGSPVEGARVSVAVNGSFDLGDQTMHAALTDAEGRYTIRDLPQGDFAAQRRRQEQERLQASQTEGGLFNAFLATVGEVTVTHPKHAIIKTPLDRVPGELDFRLAPSAVVEGRLVHEEGRPIEGLHVQIQPDPLSESPNKGVAFARSAAVDASGHYRFESLPAGDYYLTIGGLYDSEVLSLSGQKVTAVVGQLTTAPDLVVSDGRVVRFQLINKKTKEPLTFDEPITAIAWYFLSGENPYGGSLTRDTQVSREGLFEYRIDKRAVRMGIDLPLPTDDANGIYPQFTVEVPAADIEQPFLFPIDPEKVTSMKPRPSGVLNAANLLASEGKLDEAIDRLTQSLAWQESKDPQLLLRRADYLAQTKRYQEAIADYEAALDQQPEFSFYLKNNLGYLLATVKDPQISDVQRAVQLAREATEEAPPMFAAEAYDTLAAALEAAGDLQAAINSLEKAINVSNDFKKPELEAKLKKLRERQSNLVE